jgi:hypothetical protein
MSGFSIKPLDLHGLQKTFIERAVKRFVTYGSAQSLLHGLCHIQRIARERRLASAVSK